MIRTATDDAETAIILLDIVLGYGSHADMASELAPAIKEAKEKASAAGRELVFVGTIVGTDVDPQDINEQRKSWRMPA